MTTHDPKRLAKLGAEHKRLVTALDANRAELAPAIVEAIRADVPQKDICDLTGYTRESVRRIARNAGL